MEQKFCNNSIDLQMLRAILACTALVLLLSGYFGKQPIIQ